MFHGRERHVWPWAIVQPQWCFFIFHRNCNIRQIHKFQLHRNRKMRRKGVLQPKEGSFGHNMGHRKSSLAAERQNFGQKGSISVERAVFRPKVCLLSQYRKRTFLPYFGRNLRPFSRTYNGRKTHRNNTISYELHDINSDRDRDQRRIFQS